MVRGSLEQSFSPKVLGNYESPKVRNFRRFLLFAFTAAAVDADAAHKPYNVAIAPTSNTTLHHYRVRTIQSRVPSF
jgi:hypothetical protein